ncbi:hypothetical protein CEXT_156681 [Caerostris extrusa]|uniref:Uncharacterized protein n=1 Tax=Caerostris extrusa TaxID=172846 RepID=A0AAV4W6P0_CAEEX|nr:hypothetical protein CEXT_156681 [Caerostris extrusa]
MKYQIGYECAIESFKVQKRICYDDSNFQNSSKETDRSCLDWGIAERNRPSKKEQNWICFSGKRGGTARGEAKGRTSKSRSKLNYHLRSLVATR